MTLLDRFKNIRCFVLDVDGVLTDGMVHVFDSGEQVRSMNTKDGFALQLAIKKGYYVLVISGGNAPAVVTRLNKLGVTDVFIGVHEKVGILEEFMAAKGLTKEQVLYMGDDIPDYQPMQAVGLPCAPADAVQEILKISAYVSSSLGGRGCVRDVIERVLKLNNHWELYTSVPSR